MAQKAVGLLSFSAISSLALRTHIARRTPLNLNLLRCLSTKDLQPSTSTMHDYLLQNIKISRDTTDVLQIVGSHHNIMNVRHVMQALRCLFDLEKTGKCHMPKKQIVKNPDFIKLCKRLKSQVRAISLNDAIEALKIVSYIGVPGNSTIVQVLLQLVRQGVNDLSLQHIVFLEFIMKNFERSPLVDALRIALPLVFDAQLSLKIDRENVTSLATLLQYACEKPVSDNSINIIVSSLQNLASDIDVRTAANIVFAISDFKKQSQSFQALLSHCWQVLAENMNECTYIEMEKLLDCMVKKHKWKEVQFYHEEYADACARYVITRDCGFEEGTYVLKKLTRLGHVNIGLIDYLGEKIVNNPKLVQECKSVIYFSLVSGIANADYKPESWDCIKDALLTNNVLCSKEKVGLPWLRLALDFALLDIYCPDLLQFVLQKDFLQQFLAREYNLLDRLQLLLLYQAVVTMYPSYSGILPPKDMIDAVISQNGDHVEHFPLQAALERGLGGPAYVWTRLVTKLGHFIDHLVVMRKGGYPVAMNQIPNDSSSKTYIEDLLIPSDSQIILILCMPASSYAVNCQRLRTVSLLTIRTLETLGYSVVPVNLQQWINLPDYEKIPYLMQNIKMKCDTMESSEANIVH